MNNKHRKSILIFLVLSDYLKLVTLVPELQFPVEGARVEVWQLDYIQAPI